jgi:hypothetical protein
MGCPADEVAKIMDDRRLLAAWGLKKRLTDPTILEAKEPPSSSSSTVVSSTSDEMKTLRHKEKKNTETQNSLEEEFQGIRFPVVLLFIFLHKFQDFAVPQEYRAILHT